MQIQKCHSEIGQSRVLRETIISASGMAGVGWGLAIPGVTRERQNCPDCVEEVGVWGGDNRLLVCAGSR